MRHIDYDIDYAAGTLRFREPILSRSSALDPQFIVADYEVDGIASRELNAGGRVAWRSADQRLQVAATAIHDNDGTTRTNLGGVDVRFRPTPRTEIRAEVAVSDTRATAAGGNAPGAGRHRHGLADRGRASRPPLRPARLCPRARGRLRRRPAQRVGQRHQEDRHRRPRPPHRHLVADRQRLDGRLSGQRSAADRRPRLARISRPRFLGARRPHHRRRPARRRPHRPLADPAARRDPALLRQSARARRADRAADRRQRRQHRLPRPPPPLGALRGEPQRRPDRLLRDRRRREHQRAHGAGRLRARALGWRPHRADRQHAEHRRIWPAQLRRLRPVAIPGAVGALVGRFHPRRQPHVGRDRSNEGARSAPSGGERRLRRRRRHADRGFHRRDRGRDLSRRPLEPHRPRRISRRRPRGPLRRRPSPRFARSAKAARSAARSTGSPPKRRAAPARAPPTCS